MMPQSIGRQTSALHKDTSLPSPSSDNRRSNPTCYLPHKSEPPSRSTAVSAPEVLAADIVVPHDGIALDLHAGHMSQPNNNNRMSLPGRSPNRRHFGSQNHSSVHPSFHQTSVSPATTDYTSPPVLEQFPRRKKQHMGEFDTIVVRGKRGTNGFNSIGAAQASPPSLIRDIRAESNRDPGKVSSNNEDSGSIMPPKRSKMKNMPIDFANDHPMVDCSKAGDGSNQIQPGLRIEQFSRSMAPGAPTSGMMDYDMTTPEYAMNDIPNDPQEGVMNMKVEGGLTPQWNETKTKAGKERKRLPLACIACRRKKIRCSGEKPACKHCIRSRVPCVYKQSARKAAPRTDYMAMLDRRLKKMEERLLKCIPKDEANAVVAVTGRSVVKPTASVYSKKRTVDVAFSGKELDEWSKRSTKAYRGNCAENQTATQGIQADNVDDGSSALPAPDVQIHLANVYFEYLYGQAYFLLHKPSFMKRLREGKVPPVLVLSVCAVSSRFSNHPSVQHTPRYLAGEKFGAEATRLVLANFDNPDMTILTSLLLLGLHEFGTMQGGKSWSFGGMATRMAYALSLHKETENLFPNSSLREKSEDMSPSYLENMNNELRRRVMWACFTMDRFNSSGTKRLGMIAESDLEIQLPMIDNDLDKGLNKVTERLNGTIAKKNGGQGKPRESMGVAAYMIRIIALFGRVSKYLNLGGKEKDTLLRVDPDSQFAKLNRQILEFRDQLPDQLLYTDQNLQYHAELGLENQFFFLHIAYHHVRLFFHQYALPSGPHDEKQNQGQQEHQSVHIAVDSANRISEMLAKVAENEYRLVAPFMGYCAFTSANVHLLRAFSKDRTILDQAKQHLAINLRYLEQMKHYWGLFTHINDSIRRNFHIYSGSVKRGIQGSAQVLQYGDWFTRYPRGATAPSSDNGSEDGTKNPRNFLKTNAAEGALCFELDLLTVEEYFARYGTTTKAKPYPPTPQTAAQRSLPPAIPPRKISPQPTPHNFKYPSNVSSSSAPAICTIAPSPPVESPEEKIDPQLLSTMAPPPPQPPVLKSLETSIAYGDQAHSPHTSVAHYRSPMQTVSPTPSISPTYTTFAPSTILPLSDDSSGGVGNPMSHQQSPTHYLYPYLPVTVPPMTGPPTPLPGEGIWSFDQQIVEAAMLNDFQAQNGAAWFMPFNLNIPGGYSRPSLEDEMSMGSHMHHQVQQTHHYH